MVSDTALVVLLLVAALAPLLGSIASTVWLWIGGQRSEIGAISCGTLAVTTIAASLAVWSWWSRPIDAATGQRLAVYAALFDLLPHAGGSLRLEVLADGLTVVMTWIVSVVSLCVSVYALGYLYEERAESIDEHGVDLCRRPGRFATFFCVLQLFVFCMLAIVTAGGLFQIFVFWELVGLCSYLLIGFYRERQTAGRAATKAFVVNRVGDFGFLIGLGLLFTTFGTLSFAPEGGLFASVTAADLATPLMVAATLGLFAGAAGKSAQAPLQVWLPDAMAGPTPVSALVHSATMVAAGVFLVARIYPLLPPQTLTVIAYTGCLTLLLGALFALGASDVKRVLAWSTVSQLGYMMLALGVGGWAAGVFHLMTHACFKSLLFLGAGSVLHAAHHRQSIDELGGLGRRMPWTAGLMLIGTIAICGLAVPYFSVFGEAIAFSGYHSKDAILTSALASVQSGARHPLLFLVPLITAGLTAAYMVRLWCGIFLGKPRTSAAAAANPVAWSMRVAMIALAALAVFVAVGGESERGLLHQLLVSSSPVVVGADDSPGHTEAHESAHAMAATLSLTAAFAGAIAAALLYARRNAEPTWFGRRLPQLVDFLASGGRFDQTYSATLVAPAIRSGQGLAVIDRRLIDGLIHRTAAAAKRLAAGDEWLDRTVVDGVVNRIGRLVLGGGTAAGRVQTGQLRQYVIFLVAGLLCVFAAVFTLLT